MFVKRFCTWGCLLLLAACGREEDPEAAQKIVIDDAGMIRQVDVIDPADLPAGSTRYEARAEDGTPVARGWLCEEKRVGPWVYFHPNGKPRSVGTYLYGGIRQGEWRSFHENGRLESVGSYVEGEKHGVWLYYHPNGTPANRGHFHTGVRQGRWTSWHVNGKPRSQGDYRDGEAYGLWYIFDDRGDLIDRKCFGEQGEL